MLSKISEILWRTVEKARGGPPVTFPTWLFLFIAGVCFAMDQRIGVIGAVVAAYNAWAMEARFLRVKHAAWFESARADYLQVCALIDRGELSIEGRMPGVVFVKKDDLINFYSAKEIKSFILCKGLKLRKTGGVFFVGIPTKDLVVAAKGNNSGSVVL